jgi:hypothetical protein
LENPMNGMRENHGFSHELQVTPNSHFLALFF